MENIQNQSRYKEVRTTGKLLSSYHFNTRNVVLNIVSFILLLLILFYSFDGLNNRAFLGKVYFFGGDLIIPKDELKLLIAIVVAGLVGGGIQTFSNYKMYLNIYDDRVTGKSKSSILAKDFTVKIEDITEVKTSVLGGCNLIIKTASQKYKLLISNKKEACRELQKMINECKPQ